MSALGAAQVAKNEKLSKDIVKTLEEYSSALYSLEYVKEKEEESLMKEYDEIMKLSPKLLRTKDGLRLVGM